MFALSLLITGALSISHKLNSDLFSNSDKNVLTHSQEIHEKSGSYAWMSVALIAAAVALAYFGMGPQQAFLILAGVWFVNLAPFTNWLVSKL